MKITGKDYFNDIIDGIKLCINNKIDVTINFVVNKYNFKEIKETTKLCNDLGINKIRFSKLRIEGRASKNLELNYLQEKYVKETIEKLKDDINIIPSEYFDKQKNFNEFIYGCPAGKSKLYINYEGYTWL